MEYLATKIFSSNTFSTYGKLSLTRNQESFESFHILCNERKLIFSENLDSHVALVSGLHYIDIKRKNQRKKNGWNKSSSSPKVEKADADIAGESTPEADDDKPTDSCSLNTDTSYCVNPTLIQSAYNYPAATQSYTYQQGVVEFLNQLYYPSDLQTAVNEMATSTYAKNFNFVSLV